MAAGTTNSVAAFGRRTQRYRAERDLVRVATFNINNINKRLDNLLAWLAKAEPDVVSLQELKAEQRAFPVNALRTLGYEAVWQGERSWNGVAILARNHTPVLSCASLPGNPDDHQARMRPMEGMPQNARATANLVRLPSEDQKIIHAIGFHEIL
jgi:endonuclease/exonuclease/phosphatase (EEP) superfamily protein YafD